MKAARTSLALVSGMILALGYASSDDDGWNVIKIVIGLIFGAGLATSMILHPERITRKLSLFVIAPLILILLVYIASKGTLPEVITTTVVALAFLGVQFAFACIAAESADDLSENSSGSEHGGTGPSATCSESDSENCDKSQSEAEKGAR